MDEDDLKAYFVFRFLQNLNWEEEKNQSDTLTIGVVGDKNEFVNAFQKVIASNIIPGKTIIIKKIEREVDNNLIYHLVYFDTKNVQHFKKLLEHFTNTNTATIANHRSFLDYNGCINILQKNNKFRYEINFEELANQKIIASSALIELAINKK